ncbi:MAG TPA: RNA polymerase sigma factor [Methylomirabilota bacterium]|nr:RNA polymerase sigma factor [Methylomirabilota bacterium]
MKLCADETRIALMITRADDLDGVEQLVERHAERLYRLALRISGVKDDAEAVVEDALRAAISAMHVFGDESAFAAWSYRVVGRAAHERRKRGHTGAVACPVDVLPAFSADGHFVPMPDWSTRIDDAALQGRLRPVVAEAIDALPADERTALILHDIEGASKPDIADILGISAPAVSDSVHRARLFVRKRLAEFFESDDPGLARA